MGHKRASGFQVGQEIKQRHKTESTGDLAEVAESLLAVGANSEQIDFIIVKDTTPDLR